MELDVAEIDWHNCEDPQESDWNSQKDKLTSYNIRKDLQGHLAAIRTDLDSFHDTEAYALMSSGYLMTNKVFPACIHVTVHDKKTNWKFLGAMEKDLGNFALEQSKIELLAASRLQAFKIWQLSPVLKRIALCLKYTCIAAGLGLIVFALIFWKNLALVSVGQVCIFLLVFFIGLFIGKTIMSLLRYKQTVVQFLVKLGIVSAGVLIARVHLGIFDKMYLKKGKL